MPCSDKVIINTKPEDIQSLDAFKSLMPNYNKNNSYILENIIDQQIIKHFTPKNVDLKKRYMNLLNDIKQPDEEEHFVSPESGKPG
ncbi:hypothetical protein FOLKNPGA_03435 [Legionella sp. PC1000]|uniref:hypothetical protein n=1 Tax=Legionella sp. PC1000 TaxID=2746060 RepID=UPI0015FD8D4E|nr:hypothetical protein [Legionella sp. PC1000]QLZ70621.1 hypothetical protein FOLKNPGA_03435 [Legionella sp. PC1000]